jgi:2',3'-cyclic-nucleotide 2'-phosphodiesterase (5'-nucleotidase family)
MIHLSILHTNDLHSRIEQLARIARLAKQIRGEVAAKGGYCVLWDAGDAEDTILLESSITKGSAVMAVLRSAGYDLEALGNASALRYGPQAIPDLSRRFGRPLLCANMLDATTGQLVAGLEPYTIKHFSRLRVGVIGMTTPWPAYSAFGLKVGDPLTQLPDLIRQVKSDGAQTIILLSHLGSATDKQIAEQTRGLDVIIGGHDHARINPPLIINDTIIVQAGQYGEFLGRLDLEIHPETGKVIRQRGELIPVTQDIPRDSITQKAFEREQRNVQRMMQRVIGVLNERIDLAEDRECAAGNLLADALLERVRGAQVALTIAGHWTSGLEAGSLTFGALNAAIRSPANPARLMLSGDQIMQFLRQALKPENAARRLQVLRGAAAGRPHVAGMRVRYDPASLDLHAVHIGEEPLIPDRKYIVAGTDLEFYDFMGYLPIPESQIEYEVPTIMPEVLEDYIARHTPVNAPPANRITS